MLKASGLALGLPFLDSMAWAKEVTATPKRMVVVYFSYGAYMPNGTNGIQKMDKPHHEWTWWPCKDEGPLTFNKNQSPFETFKEDVSYLEGLDHEGGWVMGGHSSGDVFSTGADMTRTQTTNNISIDQVAAKELGHETRYPSLTLGTEGGTGSYGRTRTLSHYGPGRPVPSLHKPQEIFNRLFQPYAGKSVEQIRADLKREQSVLDLLLGRSKSLNNRLGMNDQRKMEEYLHSIRETEKRIHRITQWTYKDLPNVAPSDVNLGINYKEPQTFIRSMYDLMFLALKTDSTRYVTYQTESEQSSSHEAWNFGTYALGYQGATHDIAHKRPKEYSGQWDQWRNANHAYFLQKLKDAKEGDSNILDSTTVLWGCSHPHASHSNKNYPIQIAGGKNLGFKHGHLHKFVGQKKVPLANLFVSMLQGVGVKAQSFADSTGPLPEVRA